MEHIIYWVLNTIRDNQKVDISTLLSSVIADMNLNITKQEDGLWCGDYDGLEEGVGDRGIMDWIIGYMDTFYEF